VTFPWLASKVTNSGTAALETDGVFGVGSGAGMGLDGASATTSTGLSGCAGEAMGGVSFSAKGAGGCVGAVVAGAAGVAGFAAGCSGEPQAATKKLTVATNTQIA